MRALLPVFLLVGCTAERGSPTDDPNPSEATCPPGEWVEPPACGTGPVARGALLAGPADDDHDAALATKAWDHDRVFHALVSAPMGVNTELTIPLDDVDARGALAAFLDQPEAWELSDATSLEAEDIVANWAKVAGGYAGVGIAADAWRYGTLRDEGAACERIDQAHDQLLSAIEGLLRATEITGTPGVIARGYSLDAPKHYGSAVTTTPLFDEEGEPLPAEKNNGTWREDVAGAHPDYVWEDSCSRDMLMGWAMAYGAVWEVIRLDPMFDGALKDRLRAEASAIAHSLMTVQDSGYDLEIRDADGRMTYHGILHEESVDRYYVPNVTNGPNALMALGTVASLAFVAGEPELDTWLADTLIETRALHQVGHGSVGVLDVGLISNYSGHNMVYAGGVLAQRYLCDEAARAVVGDALDTQLYAQEGRTRQPFEQRQALYDVVTALSRAGDGAFAAGDGAPGDALDHLVDALRGFPAAPYWDIAVENCDADELAAGVCTLVDGTVVGVAAGGGRNEADVALAPVPWAARPPSNYHWRSDPYLVNGGGDGSRLLPAVDFRVAYWLGRWSVVHAPE